MVWRTAVIIASERGVEFMRCKVKAPVRIDFAGAWTDVPIFSDELGGATINAAINLYVTGVRVDDENMLSVSYASAIPTGSGLGSSGALNVAWLGLVRGKQPETLRERIAIAEQAYQVERILGIIGGKQDQCAAATGGIHLFKFTRAGISAFPISITESRIQELEAHLLLCYSGESRLSSTIHDSVWGNFTRGDTRVKDTLLRMRDSAYVCWNALEKADLVGFGKVLTEQYHDAYALDPSTSNERIERAFTVVNDEILGGKPTGAGGGGCMVFCCISETAKRKAGEKLNAEGYRVLDFCFDFEGLCVDTIE